MSQTILIEPNSDLKKLYALNLQTYVGTDIVERDNANDAIALLKRWVSKYRVQARSYIP